MKPVVKFKTLISLVLTLAIFAIAPVNDAEAKRFGGGKSFGKQYSGGIFKRSSKTNNAGAATASRPAGQASGASRWLGPLAGIAAGGLLAALFFGDAFEGFQLFDLLLIGGLIFLGMRLLRATRGGGQPAAAGTGGGFGGAPAERGETQFSGGMLSGATAADSIAAFDRPAWFAQADFVEGAKTHFIRLQAASDKNDLQDIATYTTPELFAAIQNDRLNREQENSFTEVVSLDAELVGLQREGDQVVATVRFSGLIREQHGAEAEAFSELWHVQHAWDDPEGDWFIAGIQQEG